MRTGVSLKVKCSDATTRAKLEGILSPDNAGGPRGMRFSMDSLGSSLVFDVRSENASTSISTAAALLRDISLFQEVWLLSRGKDA